MVEHLLNKFIKDVLLKRPVKITVSDLSDIYDIKIYLAAVEKTKTEEPTVRHKSTVRENKNIVR